MKRALLMCFLCFAFLFVSTHAETSRMNDAGIYKVAVSGLQHFNDPESFEDAFRLL